MRIKFKPVLAILLTCALSSPTVHIPLSKLKSEYSAAEESEQKVDITPDIYFLGTCYLDAYATGKQGSKIVYKAKIGNSEKYVGGTAANSTKDKIENWSSSYSTTIKIPKKVGQYEISGIEFVRDFNLDKPLGFLNNKRVSIDDLISASSNASLKPKTDIAFSHDGKPAIFINSVTEDGQGAVYQMNDTTLHTDKFTYASKNYNISPVYNSQSSTALLSLTTNWLTDSSFANPDGDNWTSQTNFKQMMEDAEDIWTNAALNCDYYKEGGPIPAATLKKYFQLSFTPSGDSYYKYLANYMKDKNISALNEDGTPYMSIHSHTNSFLKWQEYWDDYFTGGGDGTPGSVDAAWFKLWEGTYTANVTDKNDTLRIYHPYIIKLKVKSTPTDLELISSKSTNKSQGTCDAYYDKGFIYVKAVGNALSLQDKAKPIKETVKLTLENQTYSAFNNYQGLISEQPLSLNKPVDYIKSGSTITTINSKLEGDIGYKDSYIRFPVKTAPMDQKIKVKLYINSDQNPMESTFDNNPWETEVIIPALTPDLIAQKIIYSYTNNKKGSKAKVNLNLFTKDEGFDKVLSYVANHKDTPVQYKIWLDGSLIKQQNYTHAFLTGLKSRTDTFYTGTFTDSKPSYKVKVELHINPLHHFPTEEKTFGNNKITQEFTISMDKDPEPLPDYPNIPKFTNNEECIYLDKNNPQTDSMMLFTKGTFTSKHTTAKPQPYPDSSQLQWVATPPDVITEVPAGLNWGKPSSIDWKPVFPEKGIDGWVTTSPYESTGGCSYCSYDPDTLDMYFEYLRDYQCAASFIGWNTEEFQASDGKSYTVVNNGQIQLYRICVREVSNNKKCKSNCCYADLSQNHVTYSSKELHGHHSHSHSVPTGCSSSCSDDCKGGHTTTCYHNICEVKGNSCPESCSGDSLCGTTYSNENPVHYHQHTEYRLEFAASVDLDFNVKINKPSTKVVDYGTGDKITRAGYGIVTNITNVPYVTDYQMPTVSGQFGTYTIRHFGSSAVVKTPATNKKKPYLISLLKGTQTASPFDKAFENYPNPQSIRNYKEIFVDIDYPDGDFPVYFEILYRPDGFKPAKYQYMTPAEQQLYNKYKNKLQVGLGICEAQKITVKGNVWDDSWTHPTAQS